MKYLFFYSVGLLLVLSTSCKPKPYENKFLECGIGEDFEIIYETAKRQFYSLQFDSITSTFETLDSLAQLYPACEASAKYHLLKATYYSRLEKFDVSTTSLLEAEKLAALFNHQLVQLVSCVHLAIMYYRFEDVEKFEEVFLKIDTIGKGIPLEKKFGFINTLYYAKAVIHKKPEIYIDFQKENNQIILPDGTAFWKIAPTISQFNIGILYVEFKDWENALLTFKRLNEDSSFEKDTFTLGNLYHHLGWIYGELERYDSSSYYLDRALNICSSLSDLHILAQIYEHKASIEEKQNNNSEAFEALKSFVVIRDSIKFIGEKENFFFSEQQNKVRLIEERGHKIASLSESNNKRILVIVSLISFSALGIFIFSSYVVSVKKKHQVLEELIRQKERNTLLEKEKYYQEFQLKLTANNISYSKKVYETIARKLHDTLASNLAASKMIIERYNEEKQEPILEKAMYAINESYLFSRSLSHDLSFHHFEPEAFICSIKSFIQQVIQSDYLQVELIVIGEEKFNQLSGQLKEQIFRILQELSFNVKKHANASCLSIQLLLNGMNKIQLIVQDNGSGFDSDKMLKENRNGIGLKNLEYRVQYLGGKMDITSTSQKGTLVVITLIIPQALHVSMV